MTNEQTIITEQPDKKLRLRFDEASLLEYAARYPERAQEPTIWLGRFTRNKCSSKIEILQEKVRKLGFRWSYATFHKILTGKYFADGNQGSIDNLIQIVDALKRQEKLEELAGAVAFIETPTYRKIANYIDLKRAPERICKFGVVIGFTGRQKSASYRHYCLTNNNAEKNSNTTYCVHMEAPWRPSISQFTTALAQQYGVSRGEAERRGVRTILEQVNEHSALIIDNVQRLYVDRDGGEIESLHQPIFNFMQMLQDNTRCTVILSITPDFLQKLTKKMQSGYFEQFEGRAGGREEFLVLEDFEPREDVLAIARSFYFKDAEKHISYLEQLARRPGRVRILFNALQKARQLANNDNTDLTLDVLKEAIGDLK